MDKMVEKYRSGKGAVVALAAAGFVFLADYAHAALDVSNVKFDVTAAETIAGVMLVGIGVIWGIKRVIALASR